MHRRSATKRQIDGEREEHGASACCRGCLESYVHAAETNKEARKIVNDDEQRAVASIVRPGGLSRRCDPVSLITR